VKKKIAAAVLIFGVALCARIRGAAPEPHAANGLQTQSAQQPPAQQQNPPPSAPQTKAPQNPAPQNPQTPPQAALPLQQPAETLRTVVIDPGHGGADTGARGPSGVEEKNVVMDFARVVGDSLRAQGFTVVMTRIADVDPSLDDRATVANAQKDAIFISLHVGSGGPVGTVRTYTYLYPSAAAPAVTPIAGTSAVGKGGPNASANVSAVPANFVPWREAQKPFLGQSRKLGDLIQLELSQKFKGSPEISWSAPVAVLRSVEAPAVAVEISSVALDPQKLQDMGGDLADAIARAVQGYKSIYPPGGK
jgi:N-acetylmuramoyl-L-alanine amidase